MLIEISDVAERSRYEAHVDGEYAGFADYRRRDGVTVFPHTVVDSAFEGRGVGSALARVAMDAARSTGDSVVPACSFFADFIDRHPEYGDLVDQAASEIAEP